MPARIAAKISKPITSDGDPRWLRLQLNVHLRIVSQGREDVNRAIAFISRAYLYDNEK
jgi:hypothetical protein